LAPHPTGIPQEGDVWEQKKLEARKILENAQTPTRPLLDLLGTLTERKTRSLKKDATALQIRQPIDE
jgi:hypothetical protein